MKLRWVTRTALCCGMAIAVVAVTKAPKLTSATVSTETGMAGISVTLDKYCAVSEEEEIAQDMEILETVADSTVPDGVVTTGGAINTAADSSKYENLGISIANDYVNIRKKASTESKIVGKLYRGSAATILEKKGEWVKIKSGSCVGYINSEYLAIGYNAEELEDKFGTKWATVNTTTLKVREEKSTESTCITLVPEGEKFKVIKESGDWLRIAVDGDSKGYVSKEYTDVEVEFEEAISIKEEQEAKRKEEEARRAQEEQERLLREQEAMQAEQASTSDSSSSSSSSGSSSSSSSSSNGRSSSSSSSNGSSSSSSSSSSGSSSSSSSSSNGSSSSSSSSSGSSSSSSSSNKSNSSSSSSSNGSSSSSSSNTTVTGSGTGENIAQFALKFVGNPYVYGGTSLTNGADCSGFVQSVYKNFGITLPRTSGEQSTVGKSVSASSAKAGDLVFYASGGRVGHVAICIGNGQVVHASNPDTGIKVSNMTYRTVYCVKRIVE